MPGDIQLTNAAIDKDQQDTYDRVPGAVYVEKPTDSTRSTPDELKNEPLPQEAIERFLLELRNQPAWRREADRCTDYYDGNQLDNETVRILQERGQPPLISNLIKPTVDTVLGMEAKTRQDWVVRAEDDMQCPPELAEALSVKLKHAETESRADRAISDAYGAQCKAGIGWVEVSRETNPMKAPYRVSYIHRRELFWDWRAEKPDLSDARYLIRRKWLDLDAAVAKMPQYASLFRMSVGSWSGFDPLIDLDTGLIHDYDLVRDSRLSGDVWRDT